MAATTYTVAEVAAKLEVAPRDLRKFLRTEDSRIAPVGKGSRYSITGKELNPLMKRFTKWATAQAEAKASKVEDAEPVAS